MIDGQLLDAGATADMSGMRIVAAATSGITRPTLSKCTARALRQFQLDWNKFVRDRIANNADPSNPRVAKVRQRDCLTAQLLEGLVAANVFETRDAEGNLLHPDSLEQVTSRMVVDWLTHELRGDVEHINKAAYEARMSTVSCSQSETLRVVQLLVDYQNALADMSLQALVETSTKHFVEEIVDKLRPLSFL
jgi:hypothetical protein